MDKDSQCTSKAQEVADEDDQFCYMGIGCVITCLQDMQHEHSLAKELEKLKEYETCLLESHYWKIPLPYHSRGDFSPSSLPDVLLSALLISLGLRSSISLSSFSLWNP